MIQYIKYCLIAIFFLYSCTEIPDKYPCDPNKDPDCDGYFVLEVKNEEEAIDTIFSANVLFVSNLNEWDNRLRDTLLSIKGVTIVEKSAEEMSLMTDANDYVEFDVLVMAESPLSENYISFGEANFPIPAICFDPYVIYKENWEFIKFETDKDFSSTNINETNDTQYMVIEKPSHPIFKGLNYLQNDTIIWTSGKNIDGVEAHVIGFNLSLSIKNDIKSKSTLLASNLQLLNENKVAGFIWAIEENRVTKRMFLFHVHDGFQQYIFDDFFTISKNALIWVLN